MSPSHAPSTPHRAITRKLAAAALGVLVLVGVTSGAASAKGGGEAPGAPAACSAVRSMGYKGDTSTADSNVATITVSYAVKPCDTRPVRVDARVALSATPSAVAYVDASAAASGKFTVAGVRANTSYTATVTVYDAQTGTVVGSKSIFVAAIYRGV